MPCLSQATRLRGGEVGEEGIEEEEKGEGGAMDSESQTKAGRVMDAVMDNRRGN